MKNQLLLILLPLVLLFAQATQESELESYISSVLARAQTTDAVAFGQTVAKYELVRLEPDLQWALPVMRWTTRASLAASNGLQRRINRLNSVPVQEVRPDQYRTSVIKRELSATTLERQSALNWFVPILLKLAAEKTKPRGGDAIVAQLAAIVYACSVLDSPAK